MKFVIEQIAICPPDRDKALKLLAALGAREWSHDLVVASGTVREEPATNVAELAFNYELAPGKVEFEVLHYKAGDNWMAREPNSVSHLGMHCSHADLVGIGSIMRSFGIPIVQEVDTLSHTNPVIANSRRYKYVIWGTRPILGVDLKFIVRKEIGQ